MAEAFEYAIKKDIRNNPVVREVDVRQKGEILRTVALASLIVAMLIFSAWQHFEIVTNGYAIERLRQDLADETAANRKLRLQVETLRSPQAIEQRAVRDLHMAVPTAAETIIVERAPAPTRAKAVVAAVR